MAPDMPLDVDGLLRESGALLTAHYRLSSGLHSRNYVQCALLLEQPERAKALGRELASRVEPLAPTRVVAPAMGGVIIGFTVADALGVPFVFTERKDGAMTLRRGFSLSPAERILIVEDVVTTGKSTRETADVITDLGAVVVGYASILNRSGRRSPFDAPYEALLALDLETWPEGECPLCAGGVPLETPGSRFLQTS